MRIILLILFWAWSLSMGYSQVFHIEVNEEQVSTKYEPTWKSLDSRPIPKWYTDGKIGIFAHVGVFSVPSVLNSWFVEKLAEGQKEYVDFMKKNYRPGFTYADFANDFRLEFYNPEQWAELFQKAGAKYAIITSRFGDGFSSWDTKYSFNWNSMDVGPKMDVVDKFIKAMRKQGLRTGFYYCLYEWRNPLLWSDIVENNCTTRRFSEQKTWPQAVELVEKFLPDIFWSDCNFWPKTTFGGKSCGEDFWRSKEFLAWLYNESPVKDHVVVNDRWEKSTGGKHGGYWSGNDRWRPDYPPTHAWESCMSINKNVWQHQRDAVLEDYVSPEELLLWVIRTMAYGGNILIDVGPTKEGTIPVILEERLTQLGEWLDHNGEAIYETTHWPVMQKEPLSNNKTFYTKPTSSNQGVIYALFLDWPENNEIILTAPEPSANTTITMLGTSESIHWMKISQGIKLSLPNFAKLQHLKYAWTLKMTNLINA